MKTTTRNITVEQIKALRDEADKAGDDAMADLCDAALDGDMASLKECVRVIRDAEAQED